MEFLAFLVYVGKIANRPWKEGSNVVAWSGGFDSAAGVRIVPLLKSSGPTKPQDKGRLFSESCEVKRALPAQLALHDINRFHLS